MTPRVGIALAGAGALIAIGGAIGIGGDQLTNDDGDIQRIPGMLVSLALIAAGLAVVARLRTGPLATAGSTAVAVGIPVLIFFTTVNDDEFPFFSFDAVLLISTVAWLVVYSIGPARGRIVFLALALVFAPLFVMEQVEQISKVPETIGQGFAQMFGASSMSGSSEEFTFDGEGELVLPEDGFDEDGAFVFPEDDFDRQGTDLPDPTSLGLIALVFGLVYVALGHLATRRAFDGAGAPLTAVGAVAMLVGIAFVAEDLKEVGSGIALIVVGLGVVFVGAAGARRFTTWFGALLVGEGVIVLVAKALGDDTSVLTASIVFVLIGLAVVCAAHLLSAALAEAPEEDEARSFHPETRRGPDTGPALEDETFAP